MDQIPRAVKGTVQAMIDKKDEMHIQDQICEQFGEPESYLPLFLLTLLLHRSVGQSLTFLSSSLPCYCTDLLVVRDRKIEDLSGGELQRFACAIVCIQRADM